MTPGRDRPGASMVRPRTSAANCGDSSQNNEPWQQAVATQTVVTRAAFARSVRAAGLLHFPTLPITRCHYSHLP